ncbi:hypothetical protein SGRA_2883 [Saprospira grandis str. Lewin]|uniref:Uncharacterized protein n=1 Tax=Saprospira grandis (strain Lewin) TaxID=984262 RepID=H6LAL8_SAPGL|nr:hypothetical protein SGRA_2883 [Saprospira grandis str. Lewin]
MFAFAKVGTLPKAKKLCPRNQEKGFLLGFAGGEAAAGLGMDSSGPQGQTQPPKAAQGRANSELRNSPTRAKRGEAPKK